MREAGEIHWLGDFYYVESSNNSGFTALPGGYRSKAGYDYFIKSIGAWYTSSERIIGAEPVSFAMFHNSNQVQVTTQDRRFGLSVRCVKD